MDDDKKSDLLPSVKRLFEKALTTWHTGRPIRELRESIKNTDPLFMAEIDERLLHLTDDEFDVLIDCLDLCAKFPDAKP